MVSVLLEDANLLFMHVPKTGGGSISRVLRQRDNAKVFAVSGMSAAVPCREQLELQLPRPVSSYSTVAFVRNPWDWTVSGYLHVTRNLPAFEEPPAFADFLHGAWKEATILQYPQKFTTPLAYVAYHTQITPWEHLGGRAGSADIDRICTFESLADDARAFLGIEEALPHVNQSERRHYSAYYDDHTKNWVAGRHADVIEKFGYRFDQAG